MSKEYEELNRRGTDSLDQYYSDAQRKSEKQIQYVPVPVPMPMPPMMGFMPPYYGGGFPSQQMMQGYGGGHHPENRNAGGIGGGSSAMNYPMMMPFQQPAPFNFSGQYFYKPKQNSGEEGRSESENAKHTEQSRGKSSNKSSHLLALKTKTPTQIVNEFKAYTLPKLRLKRLIRLQALMRGYHTRRYLIPRKLATNRILSNYVDKLVKSYIEDKIVPDIVLEILAYNKYNEDVHLYSTEYRAHLEVMDRIILRVVREECNHVVKESTDNLVTGILRQRDQAKPAEERDPMVLVARDILISTIKADAEIMAKQCIQELTVEYVEDIHIRNLIREKYVTKAVKEVVLDAIHEIALEDLLDDLILANTKQLALPLAQHMFDQVQQEVEGSQLDKALDNYLLRGMLDIILEQANVIIEDNQDAIKDIQQTLQQSQSRTNLPNRKAY